VLRTVLRLGAVALAVTAAVAVLGKGARSPVAEPASLAALTLSGDTSLVVKAINEYGDSSGYTYHYPFLRGRADPTSALVIEPHRDTTLVLPGASCDSGCSYTWEFSGGLEAKGAKPVVKLTSTGFQHLTVTEKDSATGAVLRSRVIDVYVRCVPRDFP
jgi:hypothetical protein